MRNMDRQLASVLVSTDCSLKDDRECVLGLLLLVPLTFDLGTHSYLGLLLLVPLTFERRNENGKEEEQR
jgi:hypothetical protein